MPYRYRVLLLLSVLSSFVAYAGRGHWVIDAFAANIAAGFASALVIVVLVDRAAERRQEEHRKRIERVALRQTRNPLLYLADALASLIKAASDAPLDPMPASYLQLFTKRYTDALDHARLSGQPGTMGVSTWYSHLQRALTGVSDQLSGVLDKYIAFVGVEFVEIIEDLRTDSFFLLLKNLETARAQLLAEKIDQEITLDQSASIRDPFFAKLSRLLRYFETTTGETMPPRHSIAQRCRAGDRKLAVASGIVNLNDSARSASENLIMPSMSGRPSKKLPVSY